MNYFYHRLLRTLIPVSLILLFAFGSMETVHAQRESPVDASDSVAGLGETDLRKQMEPGVIVYGRSHRFAELGNCNSFDVSPDGKTIVCSGRKLKLFNLETNEVDAELGEDGDYYQAVQYSPDGRYIVAYTYRQRESLVRVWDAIDHALVNTISATMGIDPDKKGFESFYIQNLAVSPDNSLVAMGSPNGVILRDLMTSELVNCFGNLGWVQGFAFSPDADHFYLPNNGRVRVIDVASGDELKRGDSPLADLVSQSVAVSLSRNVVATMNGVTLILRNLKGGNDRTIRLPEATYPQHAVFSDDGSKLAITAWRTINSDNQFRLFVVDVDSGRILKESGNLGNHITQFRFTTDGSRLLAAGHSLFGIHEIDLQSDQPADEKTKFPNSPSTFGVIHPEGESLMVMTQAGELYVLDRSNGSIKNQKNYQSGPGGLLLSDDGSRVIAYANSWQGQFASFHYDSLRQKKQYSLKSKGASVISRLRMMILQGNAINVSSQAYPVHIRLSSDGAEIFALAVQMTFHSSGSAFTGYDSQQENVLRYIRLDAESGARIEERPFSLKRFGMERNQWIQAGAVSADGRLIAIGNGQKVHVADTQNGETAFELETDIQPRLVQFSPDNRYLLGIGHGNAVIVWDQETGDLVRKLELENPGQGGQPMVAFSGDGKRLLFCGAAKESPVQIYDTESWEVIREREQTAFHRASVSLDQEGQTVLFGLGDCRLEVWELANMK